MSENKPHILLAFANDQEESQSYLRRLNHEARQLRELFDLPSLQPLCEVISRQNASLDDIRKVFQDVRYGRNVVLFHYGGHADSYKLMLESDTASNAAADGIGLARFLGQQPGLRIVFLNACATNGHVEELHHVGIDAVIATSLAVVDEAAQRFAVSFYNALVNGRTLQAAFDDAIAIEQSRFQGDPKQTYDERHLRLHHSHVDSQSWPWQLHIRMGADAIRQWKLHDAELEIRKRGERLQELRATSPYRGLEVFEAEHAANYFGRQPMVDKVVNVLRQQNFVTVVGASGSGKSSLIRAGLLPALKQGAIANSAQWDIALFRPDSDPLFQLAFALVERLEPSMSRLQRVAEARTQVEQLHSGRLRINDILQVIKADRPTLPCLLLVIDQFEETFTLCNDDRARSLFLDLLHHAVETPWVRILLTLRADFTGHILDHSTLGERATEGWVNLLSMKPEELRQAIHRPAEQAKRRFEGQLVERILSDVVAQPGQLPLLEFTLNELWERQSNESQLTYEAYEQIGGVSGSIARRAESVFGQYYTDEQRTLQALFCRLVRVTASHEGGDDTRRRIPLDSLPPTMQQMAQHLASFAGGRLLVTDHELTSGATTVEVTHEALIRQWQRLRSWLESDRAFLHWRQRLLVDLERWQKSSKSDDTASRDTDLLLRGGPLAEAERWESERSDEDWGNDEVKFIQASIAYRKVEEERRLRFEQIERRLVVVEAGNALSMSLLQVYEYETVIEIFLEYCLKYFDSQVAAIATPADDMKSLILTYRFGLNRTQTTSQVSITNSLLGYVYRSGQEYITHDILNDSNGLYENPARLQELMGAASVISAVFAPLRSRGNSIGVLMLQHEHTRKFQIDDLQTLMELGKIGSDTLMRVMTLNTLEQRVTERSYELAEANEQLAELDQLKNEFIASVNHELRSPLTNIKLYLSLLADGKEERRARYMEVLQRETNHLTSLLDTSLDLAKLEQSRVSGSQKMNMFDLREAVHQAYNAHLPIAQAKQLNLQLGLPDSPVYVNGNQMQLTKAFSNLLIRLCFER